MRKVIDYFRFGASRTEAVSVVALFVLFEIFECVAHLMGQSFISGAWLLGVVYLFVAAIILIVTVGVLRWASDSISREARNRRLEAKAK